MERSPSTANVSDIEENLMISIFGELDPESEEFLKDWIPILSPDFNFAQTLSRCYQEVEEIAALFEKYGLEKDKTFLPIIKCTFLLAALAVDNLKRRTGESFLSHLETSAKNEIELFYQAKTAVNIQIKNIKKETKNLVLAILHDVLEDVLDVLGQRIIHYKSEEQCERGGVAAKQEEFLKDLYRFVKENFGSNVAETLAEFFTNFSKRLKVSRHIYEKDAVVKIGKGEKITLSSEDLGRNDYVIKIIAAKHLMNLSVSFAEKLHNLETPGEMKPEKLLELYHFADALMATGLRYHAKTFLEAFFNHYLEQRGEYVRDTFKSKLKEKKKIDQEAYEQNKELIRKNLDSIFGENNYQIEYKELNNWRVHEMMLMLYLKKEKDGEVKKHLRDSDSVGHYFFSKDMVNDPIFAEIFRQVITGRVIVKVKDEHADKLHQWRKKSKLKEFGLSDQVLNLFKFEGFSMFNSTDYYAGEGSETLNAIGYQAVCFNLIRQETSTKIKKLLTGALNLKDWEGVVSFKIMSESDYARNEYGQAVDFSKKGDERSAQILNHYKENRIKKLIGEDYYALYEILGKKLLGEYLDKKVKEVMNVGEKRELGEKTIAEIMQEISLLVKEGLFLHEGLDKTCVNLDF